MRRKNEMKLSLPFVILTLNVILPASSLRFEADNIMLCDMLCDCSHMSLYHPKNKREIKSKKIDKKKRKSK